MKACDRKTIADNNDMNMVKLQSDIAAFIKTKRQMLPIMTTIGLNAMPFVGWCCKECDAYGDQKCT